VLADRLAKRRGHFMPPSLLDSQLAALEEPAPHEHAWAVDIRDSPADIIDALVGLASQ
jgi:gluconokinase